MSESASPARLSLVDTAPEDEGLQDTFDRIRARGGAGLLNMHRTLAHSPSVFGALVGMAHALRDAAKVSRHARELIILRTTYATGGEYEFVQHRPMALAHGITTAQIEAVADWRAADAFDGRERALLAYADEMVTETGVTDDTFAGLASHFDEQEIVELTMTVAFYATVAMTTRALRVEIEGDARRPGRGED